MALRRTETARARLAITLLAIVTLLGGSQVTTSRLAGATNSPIGQSYPSAVASTPAHAPGAIDSVTAPHWDESAGPPRQAHQLTSRPAATAAGTVLRTLILANRTLDDGSVALENGTFPYGVAVAPKLEKLFIGCVGGLVVVVNSSSDRILGAVPTGSAIDSVEFDSTNDLVYATNYYANNVSIINATTDEKVGSIPVGLEPAGVTFDPLTNRILVANYGSDNVSVIDPSSNNTVIQSFPVGDEPNYIAVDPKNDHLFVTNSGGNVTIDNGTTYHELGSVSVGPLPGYIAFAASNGYLYVADDVNDQVSVIDGSTGSEVLSISVGVCPWGVAYDPSTTLLFVTDSSCSMGGNVSVINTTTNKVASTLLLGEYPTDIVDNPATGVLFATNQYSNNVSVINARLERVVGTVGAGNQPQDLAYDASNQQLFIADEGGNDLAVVNGSTGAEVTTVGTGFAPFGTAFDPRTGVIYVTNSFSNNVTEVDARNDSILGSFAVGASPRGIAYDPANGNLYVANCDSQTVSVINASDERVDATLGAGICPQEVLYVPSSGEIYVSNTGPLYATGENANVTAINGSTNQVEDSITVGASPWGETYDPANRTVLVANWDSDNLSIINTSNDRAIGSIGNQTTWSGCLPVGVAYDALDGELFLTCGLSYTTGNYVIAVQPWTGRTLGVVGVGLGSSPQAVLFDQGADTLIVTDSGSGCVSFLEASVFPPPQFTVSFLESGLHSGHQWSVEFNGTTNNSSTTITVFSAPTGHYSYTVPSVAGYLLLSPSNGSVTVNNRTVSVLLRFTPLYPVVFTETGLLDKVSWSIDWNGSTLAATGASLTLNATNGSYPFAIPAPTGYVPNPTKGTVLVNGTNATVSIMFVALPGPGPSVLAFIVTPESGPVGTAFTLSPNVSGGVGSLSYVYLGLPRNCATDNVSKLWCTPRAPGNTTVVVLVTDSLGRSSTANATIRVTENPITQPRGTTGSPTFLGLPWEDGEALLVGAAALLAVGTAVLLWRRRVVARPPSDEGALTRT
jgi:YVTN family beta-propeller protein